MRCLKHLSKKSRRYIYISLWRIHPFSLLPWVFHVLYTILLLSWHDAICWSNSSFCLLYMWLDGKIHKGIQKGKYLLEEQMWEIRHYSHRTGWRGNFCLYFVLWISKSPSVSICIYHHFCSFFRMWSLASEFFNTYANMNFFYYSQLFLNVKQC